ncbi:HlyD family type I secretion periplasmic adaptor subunit [Pelagibacterium halotolerans]|uniref:HlyD family type I secretion periplasmic adaptor subunit n=1 Tax=Pelagibacterium halotolerans TaxID=531813 RepID=UPI00384F05D2
MRRHLLVGLAVVAVLVLGVGGWAATAPLSGAVVAPGTIVVDTDVKPVQHVAGGIVAEIAVENGDHVEAGDVLVRLDDTETRSNLAIVTKRLDELAVRHARLIAEQTGAGTVSLPEGFTEAGEADIAPLLAIERSLFDARRAIRDGEANLLEQRIAQYELEIEGLQLQVDSKLQDVALVETELEGLRNLYANNLVSLSRVNALERELVGLNEQHGVLLAQIAGIEGQIAEARLQILQITSTLQGEVANEIAEVQSQIAELSEERVAAEEQLRRIAITAPQTGIVHELAIHAPGAVVAAGEPLMVIVPLNDDLVVDARIQPQDIDQVQVGQTAKLRLSALNQRTTPEIGGLVVRVGADLSADAQTGMSFYAVRIAIPSDEIARLDGVSLLPGMPAEAFIETGERTALTYLTKPLTDQIARAFREE